MRWRLTWAIGLALACVAGPAGAQDIEAVLQRSQQLQLDRIEAADADSAGAQRVRASFDRLLRSSPELAWWAPVELRVSRSAAPVAQTLLGSVVVAGCGLAELAEAERLFILAHELGHVQLRHAAQMGLLFHKWVPGEVTQQHTDAVAPLLGRDAGALAHRQEFEADAFAMRVLHGMGFDRRAVVDVFRRGGSPRETVTHPGAGRRTDALMALDLDGEPATIVSTHAVAQ